MLTFGNLTKPLEFSGRASRIVFNPKGCVIDADILDLHEIDPRRLIQFALEPDLNSKTGSVL